MIEPVTGRYLRLELAGRAHRIYFEEAGQGIPLLCLHTAGADGRQYRDLLNDAGITRDFRCVVFDMPWHGKSSPPDGWWQEEYRLTTELYTGMIMAVIAALRLDRPLVMGCSIGGRIVLDLAARHADSLRGVIGLQSSAHTEPYYDLEWLHRPDVHGGEVCAGIVSGLVAPQSPPHGKWETLWHYMQGGPGVFRGDLHFYKTEGDLRPLLARIDTGRCPVWMLTGEYDYACSPQMTRDTAAQIPGATATIMPGLGHFPMSENFAALRPYLMAILEQVGRGVHLEEIIMDLKLQDRVCLVTGASSGIGRATAVLLAAEGARVIATARSIAALDTLAEAMRAAGGGVPVLLAADFAADGAAERLAAEALERVGSIDVLINNAGGSRPMAQADDAEMWDEAFRLNFFAARRLGELLMPAMAERGWGRVVNVTGAILAKAMNAASPAKAALESWSKAAAAGYAARGVTVNCVSPGRLNSVQILNRLHPTEASRRDYIDRNIPAGRFGEPHDAAALIAFLASDWAGYITGVTIPVDGGALRFAF